MKRVEILLVNGQQMEPKVAFNVLLRDGALILCEEGTDAHGVRRYIPLHRIAEALVTDV